MSQNIARRLAEIYRNIEDDTPVRYIENGPDGKINLIAGSQHTTHVWIAIRINPDSNDDDPPNSGNEDSKDNMQFRVLKLDANRTEGFGVSRRTGRVEKQSSFNGCRYMLGDVTVRPLTQKDTLGSGLREIQEAFNRTARNRPLDTGMVRSGRALTRLYQRWVAQDASL